MTATTVGVCRETAPGERRVALVPEAVEPVGALELSVLVETGAGAASGFPDAEYLRAGARVVSRADLLARSDILVAVQPPAVGPGHRFRSGQVLAGLLRPWRIPLLIRHWAGQGLTVLSLDRAGHFAPLDAVTPQERLTGYRAMLVAAERLERCLDAGIGSGAGSVRVLVVGSGAAARQAGALARALGADVHGYAPTAGQPGLAAILSGFDIVITAAGSPGERPPVLVTGAAIRRMRSGSVLVDVCGNLATAVPPPPGVTLVRADDQPAQPTATASACYAHSITELLGHLVRDGLLMIDPAEPVLAAFLVCHHGVITDPDIQRLAFAATMSAGLP